MQPTRVGSWALGAALTLAWLCSCSSASGGGGTAGGGAGGYANSGNAAGTGNSGGINVGGSGGIDVDGGGGSGNSAGFVGDPKTCQQAAQAKTYVGCDFWPTPVTNHVWSVFDFAVVVANAGDQPADVKIELGGNQVGAGQVAPNSLQKFYLPWVPALKGADFDSCGQWTSGSSTIRAQNGAFHLTTTVPVTVYQFNALEYKGQGGPSGKSWGSCPGNQACYLYGQAIGCFSYSNDASLLLPSTAMTGNYRITGQKGWSDATVSPYIAVVGTVDGTNVKVQISSTGSIASGGNVQATGPGQVAQFSLGRGEVVELFGTPTTDPSGSLVQADQPVQVITGMPCIYQPYDLNTPACDHVEESVFPAETLGKHYFVTLPTGPNGDTPGHIVRLFGNVDGTQLTYAPAAPAGAPSTINAGQVVDLQIVKQSFEISGDKEFAVASFQLGGSVVDPLAPPTQQKGDPAQSLMTAVEQYRTKYVFLAPDDYDVSYVDVVMPSDAQVVLDGSALSGTAQPISSGYVVTRAKLGPGQQGAHLLTSDKPVGIQVMGYGMYTSYQYPGGSNLGLIAPPPPPIK